jgi:hypothetical protein
MDCWLALDEPDTAYRFLKEVEETISGLSVLPGKGSPKSSAVAPLRESDPERLAVSPIT